MPTKLVKIVESRKFKVASRYSTLPCLAIGLLPNTSVAELVEAPDVKALLFVYLIPFQLFAIG